MINVAFRADILNIVEWSIFGWSMPPFGQPFTFMVFNSTSHMNKLLNEEHINDPNGAKLNDIKNYCINNLKEISVLQNVFKSED